MQFADWKNMSFTKISISLFLIIALLGCNFEGEKENIEYKYLPYFEECKEIIPDFSEMLSFAVTDVEVKVIDIERRYGLGLWDKTIEIKGVVKDADKLKTIMDTIYLACGPTDFRKMPSSAFGEGYEAALNDFLVKRGINGSYKVRVHPEAGIVVVFNGNKYQ